MPRPRKPVEQHIIDGTYRKDRHGPAPQPDPDGGDDLGPPVKPRSLTGEAGKIWDQLARQLTGVLRARDTLLLVEMCRWWAELKRVQGALKKSRPGEKGYNQLLIGAGICSDKLDKLASRFGLTPADRAKLRAVEVVPGRPKVATRPRTKLDQDGPPKPGRKEP